MSYSAILPQARFLRHWFPCCMPGGWLHNLESFQNVYGVQSCLQEVMDRGELVPDSMVGDALLETIFDPDDNDGAGLVMDGFPRTALQVWLTYPKFSLSDI